MCIHVLYTNVFLNHDLLIVSYPFIHVFQFPGTDHLPYDGKDVHVPVQCTCIAEFYFGVHHNFTLLLHSLLYHSTCTINVNNNNSLLHITSTCTVHEFYRMFANTCRLKAFGHYICIVFI